MGMLIDVLDRKIKELRDLRQREERRDNKEAQDRLDQKYGDLTEQIHQLILALQHTKTKMKMPFQLSDVVLNDINTLLLDHKRAVESGCADKDIISKVDTDLKSILLNVKKEWSKQYANMTDNTISVLKVIAGIDTEKVSKCLEGIGKGKNWTASINEFRVMNRSLEDANELISSLGLDPQIILFLQKMNNGKATVVDLDDKIMSWLKTEELDKKVRLSFVVSGVKKF